MARTRSSKMTTKKPSAPKGRTASSRPREAATEDPAAGDTAELDTRSSQAPTDTGQRAEDEPSESNDVWIYGRIAERAFVLYLESGCQHGNDLEHWFEAEREVRVQ